MSREDEIREELNYNHFLISLDGLKKVKEDLETCGKYLPLLVREMLPSTYYDNISYDVFCKCAKKKHMSRQDENKEFVEWIKNNQEYDILLNKDELEKLENELVAWED